MYKEKCLNLFKNLGMDNDELNHMAKSAKFKARFRLLMAFDFMFALLVSCTHNCVSYNTMARNLCNAADISVSRQALHKAMTNKRFLFFIKIVFKNVLTERLKKNGCKFLAAYTF